MMELMGDVKGLEVLDLGCGDAGYGKELINLGALCYTGVESSSKMVKAAWQNLQGTQGKVIQADIEEWSYPMASFDRVVSRLVLHYVKPWATSEEGIPNIKAGRARSFFSGTPCDHLRL